MAHITVSDPRLSEYTVPNTPVDEKEAIVVVPLIVGADVIGTLNVWREGSDAPSVAVEEAELIRRFSTLAALAYANARQRERLIAQALTDELTGLSNRRHFHQRVPAELSRAAREHTATSLILFDLDDFKAINDGYGHPAGDAVLAAFAAILRDEARASDLACRIGGEEFAVLLPNTSTPDAVAFGRRVLQATRDGVRRPDTSALTASAGVATAVGGDLMAADLLSRADSRLLAAKAAGKDRLEAAPSVVAYRAAAA
jgi:diguanylate cyclase (GGDEF)-like protein